MTTTYYAPGTSGIGTRARALDWVGKRFSAGWCLYWCLTEVFKVPGLGDYDHDGSADAEDYWKAAVARGKVMRAADLELHDIKSGAGVLCWTGGSHDHGHAAYPLGSGKIVSTDLPKSGTVGQVDIELPHTQWGLKFVGLVLVDGNGFTLAKPEPPADPPRTFAAKVDQVRVRETPATRGKIVRLLAEGDTFTARGRVTADGHEWLHTTSDHYVAAEYAKAV